jgi:hypothetical protein
LRRTTHCLLGGDGRKLSEKTERQLIDTVQKITKKVALLIKVVAGSTTRKELDNHKVLVALLQILEIAPRPPT